MDSYKYNQYKTDLSPVNISLKNVLDYIRLHGKIRGHPYKISKLHSRRDIQKYPFTQRIVNDWNRLPGSAVMSASINQFKGHIDKYL